jgi:hypothetical protein
VQRCIPTFAVAPADVATAGAHRSPPLAGIWPTCQLQFLVVAADHAERPNVPRHNSQSLLNLHGGEARQAIGENPPATIMSAFHRSSFAFSGDIARSRTRSQCGIGADVARDDYPQQPITLSRASLGLLADPGNGRRQVDCVGDVDVVSDQAPRRRLARPTRHRCCTPTGSCPARRPRAGGPVNGYLCSACSAGLPKRPSPRLTSLNCSCIASISAQER